MGQYDTEGLEQRVARLEAQVAALMPLLDVDHEPTWQQPSAPVAYTRVPQGIPQVDVDVARALAAGNKIEAIKIARQKYGLGLREAKDYAERMPDLR